MVCQLINGFGRHNQVPSLGVTADGLRAMLYLDRLDSKAAASSLANYDKSSPGDNPGLQSLSSNSRRETSGVMHLQCMPNENARHTSIRSEFDSEIEDIRDILKIVNATYTNALRQVSNVLTAILVKPPENICARLKIQLSVPK